MSWYSRPTSGGFNWPSRAIWKLRGGPAGGKRRRRWRRRYSGWGSGRSLKARVNQLEKKGKAMELKTKDIAIGLNAVIAGTVIYISGTAQGDESVNREGLKINAVKLYGTLQLTGNTGGISMQNMRIIFFCDKENDGALPAVTDVLETAELKSLFKHEERKRFRILSDKIYKMGQATDDATHQFCIKVSLPFPKKGKTLFYEGTGALIGDAGTNALFMLVIATDDTTNHASLYGNLRMRYYG